MKAALAYLEREQQAEGSWFGRWGVNYVYGTWSALCALNAAGQTRVSSPMVARAADWLIRDTEPRRRLGRELRQLQARLQGL